MPTRPLASQTKLELLRSRTTTAESAAVAISRQCDAYHHGLDRLSLQAGEMFVAMHADKCPTERVSLYMIGVRNMYGRVTLRLSDSERTANEFFDQTLGLFGQAQSGLVARAQLEKAVTELASREAI